MGEQTRNIVATIAFLIGTKQSALESVYSDCMDKINALSQNKDALTIRYLCRLRTKLMLTFKKTDNQIVYEFKNLKDLEWFDKSEIKQLEDWGYTIILANKKATDYTNHFWELINDNIDRCKYLFPEWIKWEYIRRLFITPGYKKEKVQKDEFVKYMENRDFYPFQMYIYWQPRDVKNLLAYDIKFLDCIYSDNNDKFSDVEKCRAVNSKIKSNIYNFIDNSEKVVFTVDCENSNVYKLYEMIAKLSNDEVSKIDKIMLYDDPNTIDGWDYLEKFVNIPVEHIEVQRIVNHKSLVDLKMTAGVCREFYQNNVTSFILFSSDSDFWVLMSSLPDAKFLVVIEDAKCGRPIKDAMNEHGIYYCSLDDFCTGSEYKLKKAVLLDGLNNELPNLLQFNGKEFTETLFEKKGITKNPIEMNTFYEKYVKKVRLNIDSDGNFELILANI